MMPLRPSIWQTKQVVTMPEEEAGFRVCAFCNGACDQGIIVGITESAIANIALCETCRGDPVILVFAQWLAGEIWLWLPTDKIAELEGR